MRRAVFERWSAVLGACALAGAFYYYTQFAVTARDVSGELGRVVREVVDGHGDAPYQYRFLVPRVLVWITDHAHMTLAQATIVVDATAITIGIAVGLALLRRLGLGPFTFPVLLYCAFFEIGLFLYPSPETTTAFACVTAGLLALERGQGPEAWWSARLVWGVLAVSGLVLIGCRTDLVVALGIGFAVRWWQRRDAADALAAVGLVVSGVVATVVLVHLYPDAHYRSGVAVVQLPDNARALPVVVAACYLLPALGPLALLVRPSELSSSIQRITAAHLPLLAVVLAEFASSFLVGRIEEVRLFFPVAFVLAILGTELWRTVVASVE